MNIYKLICQTIYEKKDCGCIVEAMCCGFKTTDNGNMYLLGRHKHLTICDNCYKDEENGNDTLYEVYPEGQALKLADCEMVAGH